jgi:hypothetical protein
VPEAAGSVSARTSTAIGSGAWATRAGLLARPEMLILTPHQRSDGLDARGIASGRGIASVRRIACVACTSCPDGIGPIKRHDPCLPCCLREQFLLIFWAGVLTSRPPTPLSLHPLENRKIFSAVLSYSAFEEEAYGQHHSSLCLRINDIRPRTTPQKCA